MKKKTKKLSSSPLLNSFLLVTLARVSKVNGSSPTSKCPFSVKRNIQSSQAFVSFPNIPAEAWAAVWYLPFKKNKKKSQADEEVMMDLIDKDDITLTLMNKMV